MSDFAESQKLRENNDLQDLVESLVGRYLYPWMKQDISSASRKFDLCEYIVLDDRGVEQSRKDLNIHWGDSLELEDSLSKILEQQYAILTGEGDEVPYLLYSVQNQVEQPTPMKLRTKKNSIDGTKSVSKRCSDFYPNTEVYGLIDSDLSDDEKEYDILLSLLEEYVIVTEEDLLHRKVDSELGSKEKVFEPRPFLADPDAPWRFSGLCIEMESVVAADEDKGKMFTGFLKRYLPDYEVIDDDSDLESTLSQSNSPGNNNNSARRGIVFEDEMDGNIVDTELVHVIPLESYMPYSMDVPDSGFSSDEVNSSAVYLDEVIDSPENQQKMLSQLPDSWELPRGESTIPFWLQEDDEAQVLPTYQLTYSKDRIKGAYKVYWVEGERVVQFTDSDDEIFQPQANSESNQSKFENQFDGCDEKTHDHLRTTRVRQSSFRQLTDSSKPDIFAKELYFRDSGISGKLNKKSRFASKSKKQNSGAADKETAKVAEVGSFEAMGNKWSVMDSKPARIILQGEVTPRQILLATLIPCSVLGSWLGFKFMTGQT